ncbi:hypothetical protein BDV40DRAFT_273474 [Aspergillus tamarii]|uniref:Uncharacterized protein n=1 Tax=Aspergillus tamarii TaxID=41984 RepID=A0A5N6UL67_ASPTM|nr:hypothetical protein BDV40DRAFT_273474 [Aspergillus tamarii]
MTAQSEADPNPHFNRNFMEQGTVHPSTAVSPRRPCSEPSRLSCPMPDESRRSPPDARFLQIMIMS